MVSSFPKILLFIVYWLIDTIILRYNMDNRQENCIKEMDQIVLKRSIRIHYSFTYIM